jgi:hypothetical protein
MTGQKDRKGEQEKVVGREQKRRGQKINGNRREKREVTGKDQKKLDGKVIVLPDKQKTNSVVSVRKANYTDRATATDRRS